jgi:hypothetical protein
VDLGEHTECIQHAGGGRIWGIVSIVMLRYTKVSELEVYCIIPAMIGGSGAVKADPGPGQVGSVTSRGDTKDIISGHPPLPSSLLGLTRWNISCMKVRERGSTSFRYVPSGLSTANKSLPRVKDWGQSVMESRSVWAKFPGTEHI